MGRIRRVLFLRSLQRPKEAQTDLLMRIVNHNLETELGVALKFEEITDVSEFQKLVGVFNYDDLRTFLRKQEIQNSWVTVRNKITHEVRYVVPSGGVRSLPKTGEDLKHLTKDLSVSASELIRFRGIFRDKVLGIFNPPLNEAVTSQNRITDTSIGLLFRSQPKLLFGNNVLPAEVRSIRDSKARHLAMAIVALTQPSVTTILTADPSAVLHLHQVIFEEIDQISEAIEKGEFPREVAGNLLTQIPLKADVARAKNLREAIQKKREFSLTAVWPNLKGVICWTTGLYRNSIRRLRCFLPEGFPIVELGYVGNGFVGSFNIDAKTNTCAPAIDRVFYEFVERHAWETGFSPIKLLHELSIGKEYYVLVTTQSGLYRYETHDIIRVTGRVHNTPVWEVVQYDVDHTNLMGENLRESDVEDAIEELNEIHDCDISQYVLLADQERSVYDLYVETEKQWNEDMLIALFDEFLGRKNSVWSTLRQDGSLLLPTITKVEQGTILDHRAELIPSYQFDAQFDFSRLRYREESEASRYPVIAANNAKVPRTSIEHSS